MEKYRKTAIIYLVIASILWSTGGLFIKLVDLNPLAIAGARSGIAAIIMQIYLRKPVKNCSKTKLLGACTYASLLILFVIANKLTTSANAILLQFTAPIWVVLFSNFFLKEKIMKYDLITIFFVMLGMILFFMDNLKSGSNIGNFIAILSGISMAGMVLFLKRLNNDSPVEMTLVGNIITFIITLPFLFQSMPSLISIIGLLILGIFQLGISYIFYTLAIKDVSALEAILIPVLEPLLNPVWVFIFTKEAPGIYALIGGTIVVIVIIARELYAQKQHNTL